MFVILAATGGMPSAVKTGKVMSVLLLARTAFTVPAAIAAIPIKTRSTGVMRILPMGLHIAEEMYRVGFFPPFRQKVCEVSTSCPNSPWIYAVGDLAIATRQHGSDLAGRHECYDEDHEMPLISRPLPLSAGITSGNIICVRDNTCVSAQRHASILKGKTVHAATEDCTVCHEAATTPHPQKGKTTFKLTQEVPELCSTCHDPFGSKKDVHPPVKDGDCTTCHDPHSSDQPKLLAQPVSELCKTCHSEQTEFKNLHGPVAAGDCTACHVPHESDTEKLLVKEGEQLCIGCHTDMEDVHKKRMCTPQSMPGAQHAITRTDPSIANFSWLRAWSFAFNVIQNFPIS